MTTDYLRTFRAHKSAVLYDFRDFASSTLTSNYIASKVEIFDDNPIIVFRRLIAVEARLYTQLQLLVDIIDWHQVVEPSTGTVQSC